MAEASSPLFSSASSLDSSAPSINIVGSGVGLGKASKAAAKSGGGGGGGGGAQRMLMHQSSSMSISGLGRCVGVARWEWERVYGMF